MGGTLSGSIVNAATQFNIGGNRVLSAPVASNIFVDVNAGNLTMTSAAQYL